MGLAQRLREEIETGHFQIGQRLASEHDLARQHRISRVTVRKASEHLINEGLIERRPGKGLFVTGRAGTGTSTIQVVAGNLSWAMCLHAARAVQERARENNCLVQLYDAHGSVESDLEVIRQLPNGPARGAVIMSLHAPAFAESIYELKKRGYPFVLVDQRLRDLEVSTVVADNYSGGYQLGQLLTKNGHRRIGFIGDLVADTVQERLAGLRDAMGDAGLPFDRHLIKDIKPENPLSDWTPLIIEHTHALMKSPQPPTAIFASCDANARAVYQVLADLGLSIPGDVSVVGFDDDPLTALLQPGLTTVRQQFAPMGQAAFELLQKQLDDPRVPAEHKVIPVILVERDSVAPARAAT
jgi:DNA-binding LacI/PurR family transcriptional regulator